MVANLNRQKEIFDNLNQKIRISKGEISITDKQDVSRTYSETDIEEIEIIIPKEEDLIFGRINLKVNKVDIQLLELMSDEKKYLEDDLNKIAQYISMKM